MTGETSSGECSRYVAQQLRSLSIDSWQLAPPGDHCGAGEAECLQTGIMDEWPHGMEILRK